MLREDFKPANEADAAIQAAIKAGTADRLANLGDQVPASVLGYLKDLFANPEGAALWYNLATDLERSGFRVAAVQAYLRMEEEEFVPSNKGAIYEHIAKLLRRFGLAGNAAIYQRVANRWLGRRDPTDVQPELERGELYVMAAHNDPEAYQAVMDGLGDYELRHDPLRDPWGTKLVAHSVPPGHGFPIADECSFFVMDGDGQPILQVEADAMFNRSVGCRETGVVLTPLVKDHPLLRDAEKLAVRQLSLVLEWSGTPSVLFDTGESTVLPVEVRSWIIESQAKMAPYSSAWIDLGWDADRIEANYREAHRQSLRWGRKNVTVSSCRTPEPEMLKEYDAVFEALERIPGMPSSEVARFLTQGLFTLYIGKVEDRPMVALISSRHGKTSYYWASAKLRLGNKPLGHVVLHQAIMDAKAEGQTRFDFGMLQDSEAFSEKLRSIALYKRGFATHTERRCLQHGRPLGIHTLSPNSM